MAAILRDAALWPFGSLLWMRTISTRSLILRSHCEAKAPRRIGLRHSPISSFHSAGFSAMNLSIIEIES